MSTNTSKRDSYAATAYTPTKRQQWETVNPKRDTIFGSRLPWNSRTIDNGTKEEYGFNNIAIADNWESQRAEKGLQGDDIFKEMKVHYDHQRIMPPNFTALSHCLVVGAGFGLVAFWGGVGIFCFLFLHGLVYLMLGESSIDHFVDLQYGNAIFFGLMALVGRLVWEGGKYLQNKHPALFLGMKKAPLWQANRQTGLLTIYHPRRAWECRLEAPFWEFDAFLQSSPDTQGSLTYSLILYHPFQGVTQKLDAQFPPSKMPGELVAAWQFLQRYMDVSQPLPDVPGLEVQRHKDPTTAAADKKKGRPPRYWRDMKEEDVKKIQQERYQKNIRLR